MTPRWRRFLLWAMARLPHKTTVGRDDDSPYLTRGTVLKLGRFGAVYLHRFHRGDQDRVLHDHPFAACGVVLAGGYHEETPHPAGLGTCWRFRRPGTVFFWPAEHRHRVVLDSDVLDVPPAESWSLFIRGPHRREWGFWLNPHHGPFMPWRDYLGLPEDATESRHEP